MTLSPKIRDLSKGFRALSLWAQALAIIVLSRLFVVILYLVWQRYYGESATLFESLFRYDCAYYKEIAQNGYVGEAVAHLGSGQVHWSFFSLAPVLEEIVSRMTGLDVTAAGGFAWDLCGALAGAARSLGFFLLLLGIITTWQWFCNTPVMA